eukprot:Skav213589  [mRNA]  locus=scaffold1790:363702:364513:+ [translate_table: standard]
MARGKRMKLSLSSWNLRSPFCPLKLKRRSIALVASSFNRMSGDDQIIANLKDQAQKTAEAKNAELDQKAKEAVLQLDHHRRMASRWRRRQASRIEMPGARPSTPAALPSFSDELAPSEIDNDSSAAQSRPMQDIPLLETELSEVTHLLRGMMTGLQELKNRADQAQATTEGQHAALHQSFGPLQQMQEQQTQQADRLGMIEQNQSSKSAE